MALFVTFEGLDGSGKSTHLSRAARALEQRGYRVLCTKEPGGTRLGEIVRSIFLDPPGSSLDSRIELLLLFASRRQHLVEVIEPALATGSVVLCDRFTDSTYAYQGYGRGIPFEIIEKLDCIATGGRRPDRTLLLDLPAPLARERVLSGRKRVELRLNRLDRESIDFYERVRAGFLELAQREPERFRIVDASGTIEQTQNQVLTSLTSWLGPGQALERGSEVDRAR